MPPVGWGVSMKGQMAREGLTLSLLSICTCLLSPCCASRLATVPVGGTQRSPLLHGACGLGESDTSFWVAEGSGVLEYHVDG